ncbi:MAG TPA: Stp1/IreP family PP2C-type Ser/Thr phosphatase [Verrucomicrobiae bacterium]|nr:Stp1/IreP family PP2C-type Ser/Thr phosphatase [Verrucomicrobiae bacterium]
MKLDVYALSDVGRKREQNEDSFMTLPERGVVAVCDGMGGHKAGEVASRAAVDALEKIMVVEPPGADYLPDNLGKELSPTVRNLIRGVRLANRRIFRASAQAVKMRGMGTTVVAGVFTPGQFAICHVGDSRCYLLRDSVIRRLTVDHSWMEELIASGELKAEEAQNFPDRNFITRALGIRPAVKVDVSLEPVKTGDVYLFCSDGLSGMITDDEILEILLANSSLEKAAAALIERANANGGDDNVTVVLVRVIEADGENNSKPPVFVTVPEESEAEAVATDQLLLKMFGKDDLILDDKEPTREMKDKKKKKWLIF